MVHIILIKALVWSIGKIYGILNDTNTLTDERSRSDTLHVQTCQLVVISVDYVNNIKFC